MLRNRDIEATEEWLKQADAVLTHAFLLPEHKLEFNNLLRHFGECSSDGLIVIRIVNSRQFQLLTKASLLDTLCHELAHLIHMNHKSSQRRLQSAMKVWYLRNYSL